MKTLQLSRGAVTLVDDHVFDVYGRYKWSISVSGYAVGTFRQPDGTYRTLRLHRLILDAKPNEVVHHVNGDKLDNRIENLVAVTHQGKHIQDHWASKGPQNGKPYRGVYSQSNTRKWRALLLDKGRRRSLGYFDTPEEAARAWDKAAVEVFGPGCFQNFKE